jgi:hypothetical protein
MIRKLSIGSASQERSAGAAFLRILQLTKIKTASAVA